MSEVVQLAIQSVTSSQMAFCKFLSANDTGETGGHQSGIYISKQVVPIIFSEPGHKGENKERLVQVKWQNRFTTDARFKYYGCGTRNEYRITRFGQGFPYLKPDYTGSLFVFAKRSEEQYEGYVISDDDDIDDFLNFFNISAVETNRLIDTSAFNEEAVEKAEFERFIQSLQVEFPESEVMSEAARRINDQVHDHVEAITTDPDQKLLDWTAEEYKLFRELEYVRYGDMILHGFSSVEQFVETANKVLNRRKSRAGKSLEHHLAALFDGNNIRYTPQAVTEQNKKPDFLFPSEEDYHNSSYPVEKLVSLAAKTTCKDRWRQVLNEADRFKGRQKFLCTLQQGNTEQQLSEMEEEQVTLVVPKPYIKMYPQAYRDKIWTLQKFIGFVKELEQIT